MCPEIFRVFYAFQIILITQEKIIIPFLCTVSYGLGRKQNPREFALHGIQSHCLGYRDKTGLERKVICQRILCLDPGKSRKTACVSEGSL